jgi:hypothetical protein
MQKPEDALDKTQQAFYEWRKNRTSQGPIPQYLWDMVPPLLANYPKPMIRRALSLSSAQLTKVAGNQQVDFVEAVSIDETKTSSSDIMNYSSEPTEAVCDVELKRTCGAVLKINSLPISIVTVLIPSFLGD